MVKQASRYESRGAPAQSDQHLFSFSEQRSLAGPLRLMFTDRWREWRFHEMPAKIPGG
jgi:hypothetical protein